MKKIFYIVGAFLFAMCFLIACSYSLSSQVKDSISEESNFLYFGDCDLFYVTLTSGMREEPYLHDGKSMPKQNFAVICVTFYENVTGELLPFDIVINDNHLEGSLEKNPFSANYMTDLEIVLDNTATIKFSSQQQELSLICKSDDFQTTSKDAIQLALEHLNDDLLSMFKNTKFNAECYLKIINNPHQNKNVFFWYFTIKSPTTTVATIIIDTMSKTVLAKY